MVAGRDENGKFKKGEYKGGPGRPPKTTEAELAAVFASKVTPEVFATVMDKVIAAAAKGDHFAWELMFKYGIGTPTQRIETSGPNGGPQEHTVIYLPDNGRGENEP